MIEEQIRGRGGNKALAFFLGDVDAMDNLSVRVFSTAFTILISSVDRRFNSYTCRTLD